MDYILPALPAHEVTALIGALRVPVIAQLADGYLAWANSAAEALFGTTMQSIQGKRVIDLPLLGTRGRDALVEGERYQVTAGGPGPWVTLQVLELSEYDLRLLVLLPSSAPRASVTAVGAAMGGRYAAEAGAGIDPSSGLLDRASIAKMLETEVSRSRRYANPLSVLVVRLAASEHRSQTADPVSALGRTLEEETRWADRIGRWDARDLLLVLPETTAVAARALVAKLEQRLGQEPPPCSVIFGVAEWMKGDDESRLATRAFESLTDGAPPGAKQLTTKAHRH